MSLNLPLPKQVFGHPWLLMEDGKMSKSKGNVIYADDLVQEFGVDAVRYYFLHEIPFANDGVFSRELFINVFNADLVNTLGNLVNRTINMNNKYFEGIIQDNSYKEDIDNDLINVVTSLNQRVVKNMDELRVGDAISEIFDVLKKCNKYIDDTMPWSLAKDEANKGRLGTILYNLLESIRICSVYLSAYLPETAEKIFKQLNTDVKDIASTLEFGKLEVGKKVSEPIHLFERIEEKE